VKLYAGGDAVKSLEVWKGAANVVKAGFKGDLMITVPKGEADKLKAELLCSSRSSRRSRRASASARCASRTMAGGRRIPRRRSRADGGRRIFGRAWDTLRLWLK